MGKPKPNLAWGLYNFNRLIQVESRKKDAIRYAEDMTGEPWSKCRKYMQVMLVRVSPADDL